MNAQEWELQKSDGQERHDTCPERRSWSVRRIALRAGIVTGALVTIILGLRFIAVPVLLYFSPELDVSFFDLGLYGAYPQRWYRTIDLPSPTARVVRWNETCNGEVVLLSIGGPSLDYSGPLILDAKGEFVWTSDQYGASGNLKVQQYQGKDYLTFWAGEKLQESGQGMYYMLDSSYETVHTVSAVGKGLYGDLHEFEITDEDSALITVYNKTHVDTSDPLFADVKDGFIIDGIAQEIDIATGELLFQWRASDHFDHPLFQSSDGGYVDLGALDYFHMNSIDKDTYGNYLISLRHLQLIVYVEGATGDILWALGEPSQDFDDVTENAAINFHWQHDARWVDREAGLMSVFDNGIARHHYEDAPHSEGRLLKLDLEERTVKLVKAFRSPTEIRSASQGSVQKLPPGKDGAEHFFVGWGASGAYSEFSASGQMLCEVHFAASSLFYFERAKSYRAIKAPAGWKGEPAWDPGMVIEGTTIFVSWMGATEVAWWMLQGHRTGPGVSDLTWEDLDVVQKDSFETVIEPRTANSAFATYRVAALDAEMNVLRYSNVQPAPHPSKSFMIWSIAIAVSVAGAVIGLLVWFRGVLWERLSARRERFAYRRLG